MIQTSKSTLISHIIISIFTLFLLPIRCFCSIDPYYEACVPKDCGNGHNISYPFYIHGQQESYCGYPGFELNCTSNGFPLLHIPDNDYVVQQIHYGNQSIRVSNAAAVLNNLENGCFPLTRNVTLERNSVFRMENYSTNLVFLSDCKQELDLRLRGYGVGCGGGGGGGGEGLVMLESDVNLGLGKEECGENVVAPVELDGGGSDGIGNGSWSYYEELLRKGFLMKWTAGDCSICADSGGRCGFNQSSFHFRCFCPDRPHAMRCRTKKGKKKVVIAVVAIGSAFILVICLAFMIRRLCKWSKIPSYFSSRKSTKDLEAASVYFRVPIFSYKELEEATHSFDANRELGDGGFGAVFYGKLKDGREVAVKRLYEHNYKRVEQFMNEVEILTRLRHPNLVLLYGCTSHRSRELLLVYEYIPNGTVADHLHGDRAKPALLTWAIRMNIAIETASALAYLHKSDIIHRDVKSNNILLDENFSVKVADFGLSRLFPTDVTHVSTAPQGTPGYVDPEYHQCYQLTDKSDVYSFGVVLVELISSMPAVDISRHRHEINLSNFALNRIQKCEFNELIDPNIGFGSDERVNRMTTSVAELAFRCLQFDKEMRPTMDEALVVLKEIHGIEIKEGAHSNGQVKCVKPPPSPETEEARLLKDSSKFPPPSPISVTGNWHSGSSTTPYTSS